MTIHDLLTPRSPKLFLLPTKLGAEMTEEELDALADQMAEALGLTFEDETSDSEG